METHGFLEQALIYLAAGVIAVPIFKKAGLGPVLGYLIAGVIIGPWGLRLISDPATDRKSTRLNSSHLSQSRMPSSA